ncbi:AP-3 complex subunit mu [Candida viswanathii]|uniref:AP-3 complex subunit mu n=1 Tax=Candida viswanathii TaxID=5486 RepID=A0A367XWR1_9ASCO|nr:AP-3 complex subunit mu [Candida viswanathii]
MIEALYITDSANSLVYEFSNSLSTPKFKSLLPKISASSLTDSNKISLNSQYYLYRHQESSLSFYLLCENDSSNVLFPQTFVQRLIEAMEDYFGELNSTKIEANNDTLTLLLYQMLDDGIPHVTDFNKLRDLVSYKSFLSKILSGASTAATKATGRGPSTLDLIKANDTSNDIPWRRNNVRHTNNEMYVDVIETVNAIIKPVIKKLKSDQTFDSAFYSSSKQYNVDNHMISGHIDGEISFLSRLTGVPLLELALNSVGSNVEFPSLHKCINRDTWKERRGIMSFIPPDGRSTLMKYQIDLNKTATNAQKLSIIRSTSIDTEFICHDNSSEFEIRLNLSQQISKVDFITVEIVCEQEEGQVKLNRATHGDFSTKGNGKAEWNLRQLKSGVSPVFYGSIISKTTEDNGDKDDVSDDTKKKNGFLRPNYIRLVYSHRGPVPSGLKVDSLKIISAKGLGDTVKPYKGVKYITKSGSYIVRL